MQQARTFDGVAALYDAQRAGYPEALFHDLRAIAGLAPGDRALEVGCGPGQATSGFVALGLDVTALDPGPALVERARQKFADAPNVRFAVSAFEDWPPDDGGFRLVAAAQSWHWVDGTIRFAKAAKVLAPGGHLAVFGHTPVWSAELLARLEPVYLRLAPEIWMPPPENWYLPEGPIPALFAASGCFEPVRVRGYTWSRRYSPQGLAAYIGTLSRTNTLPEERRDRLLAEVEAVLPQEVDTDWTTTLFVAMRSSLR